MENKTNLHEPDCFVVARYHRLVHCCCTLLQVRRVLFNSKKLHLQKKKFRDWTPIPQKFLKYRAVGTHFVECVCVVDVRDSAIESSLFPHKGCSDFDKQRIVRREEIVAAVCVRKVTPVWASSNIRSAKRDSKNPSPQVHITWVRTSSTLWAHGPQKLAELGSIICCGLFYEISKATTPFSPCPMTASVRESKPAARTVLSKTSPRSPLWSWLVPEKETPLNPYSMIDAWQKKRQKKDMIISYQPSSDIPHSLPSICTRTQSLPQNKTNAHKILARRRTGPDPLP